MATTNSSGATEVEATDVRQGRWGRHVLWVLVIGMVLAIAALFGSWAFRADDFARSDRVTTPAEAPNTAVLP